MKPLEKKILVAVDGSLYSDNSLQYLCQLFSDVENVHFHLLALVHCASMSAGVDWLGEQEMINSMRPEIRTKYAASHTFIKKAKDLFTRQGIDETRITSSVHVTTAGIAGEIIHHTRQGLYDAVVIGRRGVGKVEEWILGSVSQQVLEKCTDVPIWIVDGKIDSNKFFVPVDGTPYSLKAIDHIAFVLQDHPTAEITLFNSKAFFTKNVEVDYKQFEEYWGEQWCESHLNNPDSLFDAPRHVLLEAGFPEERIHTLQTSIGLYPSRQIVRQALMDGFGTIVMGRREGLFKKGYFKGVSDRVVAMAVETSIWIV